MKRPGSPPNGFIQLVALVLLVILLALASYFFWDVSKQQPPAPKLIAAPAPATPAPSPPALVDSQQKVPAPTPSSIELQKVDAKRKLLRFHEDSLRDLEKKLGERNDFAGQKSVLREITDKKGLIAKIKAEIGEH